jgi:cobalt/nickel transport system ATP-binding protein
MPQSPEETVADQAIFNLENVSFAYPQGEGWRDVLRDVTFSLGQGEQLGLYGPNGCGKTTLFRCITGLERCQRGTVRFHGKVLVREGDFRPLRCAVGYVLQNADDQLFFPTVLEDVAFGPLNLGMSAAEARDRAMATLAELGLEGLSQRLTHHLSGGERRLISLATVLAMQPEALLLDEPTNGLDRVARTRLIEILRALPTARIVVSHDWDFLSQVATGFVTMMGGKLTATAPAIAHTHVHAHPHGDSPHDHGEVED